MCVADRGGKTWQMLCERVVSTPSAGFRSRKKVKIAHDKRCDKPLELGSQAKVPMRESEGKRDRKREFQRAMPGTLSLMAHLAAMINSMRRRRSRKHS